MVDSNDDNQECPLQSGRLSRFSVLPNIPTCQQSTKLDEDIKTEVTTENKDQYSDRPDISTRFEVLPNIGQKLPNSAHSSLGYYKVEFPEHSFIDDTFDDSFSVVMTSTIQYMKQLLQENDTIILVGVPGSGKTTLGKQMLQCLANEFASVPVHSVTQLVQKVKFDENQFFFFDDAFGNDMPNFDRTLWKTLSCTWKEKADKKKMDSKSSKLILSTRNECLPHNIPFASILVDMSKNNVFGYDDRKQLLSYTNIINKKEIDNIIHRFDDETSNGIGFPLCSRLYTSTFFSLDATEFFNNPLKFLLNSYQNLISESEMADCISEVLVLNGGTFKSGADSDANTKTLIDNITTNQDVLTFSKSVMKPFLNVTNEKIIQFVHPILLTATEIHIYNNDQRKGLKYMSIETISKYINIPSKLQKKTLFGILQVNYLSCNNLCLLAHRMLSAIFQGNIRTVCSHPLWKKQTFINDFQNALQEKSHNDKDEMIQILYNFFLIVDDIFCDGVLFWSAHYGHTNFCDMLLKLFGRCRKHEDLSLNILSRALIGACLNSKSLILVLQLVKYGADISYCEACFKLDSPSIKFQVLGNTYHFCPLQAVVQSGNLQSFKYLLKKGATISHSTWIQWELLCKLAEVSYILACSFDFVLALEETFSKGKNIDNVTTRQPDNKSIYLNFIAMLKDIQDPSDINDIFFTFIHHSFISPAFCEVFSSFGLDITYCDRKQRNAINILLRKYKADPQCIPLNEVSCLQILLKIGIDPNNAAVDGTFPICLAIGEKSINIEVIQMLLQAGANVDNRTLDGLTPLHLCIKSNMSLEEKLSLISLLLEYGAQRNITDLRKRTYSQLVFEQPPIHSSVLIKVSKWPLQDCLCSRLSETEKIRIIKELVNEDIDVNIMDRQNQTPLLLSACKLNNLCLTKAILSLGGDANILYEGNYSILQKLLLSRHANVEGIFSVLIEAVENVYHLNEEGDTALLTALKCKNNRFREIKTLLNITLIDLTNLETKNKNQQSVLHLATASNTLTDREACDICKTYISICGRINDRDIFGKTALEYASLCSKQRTKSICLLLKHTDTIEIGSTFLLNLIQNKHMSDEVTTVLFNAKYYEFIVQEDENIVHKLASICPVTVNQIILPFRHLCESGVDVDLPDCNGNTPLIKSCSSTITVRLAMELIKRGADVNLKNEKGNTALHECILSSAPDTVLNLICNLFMNNSFNFSIRNSDGLSVFHLLVENRFTERSESFNTILKATTDINLTDSKGNTVLHKIIMLGEKDTFVSESIKKVLGKSDAVDTEIKGSAGTTILNTACSYTKSSRFSTILVILNHGADIYSKDKFGNTPLYNVIKFLKGRDIVTVFERFIRVLALLSLDCDLEGTRTDTPVQLSQTCQYRDVSDILTNYDAKNMEHVIGLLNKIVQKLLYRYRKRLYEAKLPCCRHLSKNIIDIISEAYSRICHLRFDAEDNLELGSDFVDIDKSVVFNSPTQSVDVSSSLNDQSSTSTKGVPHHSSHLDDNVSTQCKTVDDDGSDDEYDDDDEYTVSTDKYYSDNDYNYDDFDVDDDDYYDDYDYNDDNDDDDVDDDNYYGYHDDDNDDRYDHDDEDYDRYYHDDEDERSLQV